MLRVRLASLFGCPIWMVGEMVPASELPLWRAHFSREPWGFTAQDMSASKTAFQIGQVQGAVRPGTSYRDFMFTDPYESLSLTEEQFDELSEEEQLDYVRRQIALTKQVLN